MELRNNTYWFLLKNLFPKFCRTEADLNLDMAIMTWKDVHTISRGVKSCLNQQSSAHSVTPSSEVTAGGASAWARGGTRDLGRQAEVGRGRGSPTGDAITGVFKTAPFGICNFWLLYRILEPKLFFFNSADQNHDYLLEKSGTDFTTTFAMKIMRRMIASSLRKMILIVTFIAKTKSVI